MAIVRRHFKMANVTEYGKVKRVDGEDGETMLASSLQRATSDRRDATYVRVRRLSFIKLRSQCSRAMQYQLLVDIYANDVHAEPVFEMGTFYGQLQHIYVVHLPANQDLRLKTPTTHFLAGIRSSNIAEHNANGMPRYKKAGAFEVVDMTSVQSLVGRIFDRTKWTIIDRSGGLLQAGYDPNAEEESEGEE